MIHSTEIDTTALKETFISENSYEYNQLQTEGFLKIEVADTGCGISSEGI